MLLAPLTVVHAGDAKPNILLIVADDLGWSDLACYGADLHETPHLDRFAQQGVRFTNAYAMSVCSPSRAALLTGKHAARLQITTWAEGSRGGPKNRRMIEAPSLHDLPLTEPTLARRFHDAGYLTALVGKWHLGDADHTPEAHGFDVNIGGTQWGAPQTYFSPYSGKGRFGPEFRFVPDLAFGKPGEYLTDRLTDEALRVIDQAGKQPFFLYFAHHAPHTPIEAKPDDIKSLIRRAQAYEACERYKLALQDVRQVIAFGVDAAGKATYDLANGMQHRLNRVIAQLKNG
jgi:arylsulfatase A-like enzyme